MTDDLVKRLREHAIGMRRLLHYTVRDVAALLDEAARALQAEIRAREEAERALAEVDEQLTNAGPHIAEAGLVGQYIGHHVDLAISMARAHRSEGRHYMHETIEFWQEKCAAAEARATAAEQRVKALEEALAAEPEACAEHVDYALELFGPILSGAACDALRAAAAAIRARSTQEKSND